MSMKLVGTVTHVHNERTAGKEADTTMKELVYIFYFNTLTYKYNK